MPPLNEIRPRVNVGDLVGEVTMVSRRTNAVIPGNIPIATPEARPEITVYRIMGFGESGTRQPFHKLKMVAATNRKAPVGREKSFLPNHDKFFSVDSQAEEVDPITQELAAAGYSVNVIISNRTKSRARREPIFSVSIEGREPKGDRVYVNEDAFADLASQSRKAAKRIYGTLMRVNIVKATHSQLQQLVEGGALPRQNFDRFFRFLEGDVHSRLTELLHDIVYRPSDPDSYRRRYVSSVLPSDKNVLGSCHDRNIKAFTYATGVQSTDDMFWEMGAIPKEDPDLTVIGRGKKGEVALLFLDREIGTGENTAQAYSFFKQSALGEPISDANLDEIKDGVRNQVLNETAKIISDAYPWYREDDNQRQFLMGLFSAFLRLVLTLVYLQIIMKFRMLKKLELREKKLKKIQRN